MSYHRYTNLREIFQGDLVNKLMDGIQSLDFIERDCNCRTDTKVNGKCLYGGNCRVSCIVYSIKCKICKKEYIGQTQQHKKERVQQHLNDIRLKVKVNKESTSLAKHFAQHFEEPPKPKEIREVMELNIIKKLNPISVSKSFKKMSCRLCMAERLEILKRTKFKPQTLINSSSEIYGACRHKTKFHRYVKHATPSADELGKSERVCPSNQESFYSRCHPCADDVTREPGDD